MKPPVKVAPKHAVSFFQGKHGGSTAATTNAIPALLWLWGALVLILVYRNKALPDPKQAVTLLALGGGVVVVGSFTPMLVGLVLLGAVVAAAFNVPGVPGALTGWQARIAAVVSPGK